MRDRDPSGQPGRGLRLAFVDVGGDTQPAPAPRYSQTATATPAPAPMPGADSDAVLASLGMGTEEIATLREAGTVG